MGTNETTSREARQIQNKTQTKAAGEHPLATRQLTGPAFPVALALRAWGNHFQNYITIWPCKGTLPVECSRNRACVRKTPAAWETVSILTLHVYDTETVAAFCTTDAPTAENTLACAREKHCVEADPQLLADTQAYLRRRVAGRVPERTSRQAWDRFHGLYAPLIDRIVAACGVSPFDFDDCVQEVWMEIVRKLPSLDYDPRRGRFCSWLSIVTRRKVLQLLRRRGRRSAWKIGEVELGLGDPDPAVICQRKEERQSVQHALAVLRTQVSAVNYQVLHLTWIDGHSVSEIARRLDLTHQQVWYRHHRTKQKLRRLLEVHGEFDPGDAH